MKITKIIFVAIMLIGVSISSGEKKTKNKEYVRLEKTSKLKKYNPHAVWRKVRCKHCNGTGSWTKQKYDAKKNSMKKWLVPCPYCKGKGTRGMSKY